jgi:3-oxoacyl-ACP reductase-like protein
MSASSHDELIAELYALPIDEFTSARDALAKRLRADGEREVAKQVKALRKPSVTAWAVNRVRHREPERVEELLEAGERLRQAQEQVIRSGELGQLRDAGARERDLVESLVDSALAELAASGHAANPWSSASGSVISLRIRQMLAREPRVS